MALNEQPVTLLRGLQPGGALARVSLVLAEALARRGEGRCRWLTSLPVLGRQGRKAKGQDPDFCIQEIDSAPDFPHPFFEECSDDTLSLAAQKVTRCCDDIDGDVDPVLPLMTKQSDTPAQESWST
ncbi:hypothetical protein CB1_000661012 [Camelus ferus]|nr:hypothetical protein CB1_000661012 [Camelus ferus]